MNLAEQLKKEMGADMLPDWFAQEVVSRIKSDGRASFRCTHRVNEVSKCAFPLRYEHALYEWAEKNGFNAEDRYNSYGVRYIVITL